MGKKTLLLLLMMISITLTRAQNPGIRTVIRRNVNLDNKIIKDSSGVVVPADEWHKRMASGIYKLSSNALSGDTMVLVRMTEEDIARRHEWMPPPPPSPAFPVGEKKELPKLKDINGNKIDFKALEGKVVVLNFWFIACEPCKMEIPELNKLVTENPEVVFIAVGLDLKYEIKDFLKVTAFKYQQTYDGREYARNLSVGSYPTNVVIDKKGITRFSSSGYGTSSIIFLRKALSQAKAEN
ncbi:hypothetical protein A0256_02205 [Mucilaginibacter sp. PAMC 26640]|nr:hypothetical protein A0256_02205 [Mucilaginibacter sp. PAMC 26640]